MLISHTNSFLSFPSYYYFRLCPILFFSSHFLFIYPLLFCVILLFIYLLLFYFPSNAYYTIVPLFFCFFPSSPLGQRYSSSPTCKNKISNLHRSNMQWSHSTLHIQTKKKHNVTWHKDAKSHNMNIMESSLNIIE